MNSYNNVELLCYFFSSIGLGYIVFSDNLINKIGATILLLICMITLVSNFKKKWREMDRIMKSEHRGK